MFSTIPNTSMCTFWNIFTALTAYDTQRIGRMAAQMNMKDGESAAKFGIFGALKLYLDFINMFLFMLRLFGRRR